MFSKIQPWQFLFAILFLVALGCGGGGGGTNPNPTTVNVIGNVLWIETGSAPSPTATVRIGQIDAQTGVTDGFFSVDVPPGATSLTVTYSATGASTPIVRTFNFPAINADTDLRELYIGPEEVTLTGTLLDSTNNQPVASGVVTIAGKSGISDTNGVFSVPGVAYSSSTLAVFLGLQATVTQPNYFDNFFSPPSAAISGVVNVGNILLTPKGSDTPPGLPFNLSGTITPSANAANASVQALQGATVIRTVTADASGNFKLWLPEGTYTITATKGSQTGSTQTTITNVSQIVTANVSLN